MAQDTQLLNVLVIAHDAKAMGGVNNFLRIMRRKLFGQVNATRFSNGRREGERGKFSALKRLVWDYSRFCGLIVSRRFDVLHINPTLDLSSLPRELVFPILSSVLSPSTKKILFYRGWDWKALEAIKRSPVKLALYKFAHRRLHRILVLSEEFRQSLIANDVPAEKVFVVSTMFEGDRIREALQGKDISAPRRSIAFLSRFLPAKGGAELIEAFSRLRVDYPDLHLIMAGDGPSRVDWEQIAAQLELTDSVVFTGYVLGRAKMDYLVDAEIFALPTTHPEGMPNAILEAMAAGCAILATPIAGIRDVVRDGVNGTLISMVTVTSIEVALRDMLSDRAALRAIGRVNHDVAWQTWESGIVSNRIGQHYRDLAVGAAAK